MLCGITTAPRDGVSYLERARASIEAAGFEPVMFYDSANAGPVEMWRWSLEVLVTRRDWRGDRVVLFQDDVLCCRDLAEFARDFEWPENCGVLSFYKPSHYDKTPGLVRAANPDIAWGACALMVRRDLAERLYRSNRRLTGRRYLDRRIGAAAADAGLDMLYCSPSLVQHVGSVSAIGGHAGGAHGRRAADDFIGEESSAMEYLPCVSLPE